jgi:formylglycine-generating enzyme required for sulfatase activity
MNVYDQITKYVLDNSPRVVGAIILAALGALGTWLVGKVSGKSKKKPEGNLTDVPAPPPWSPSEYLTDLIRRASTLSFGDPASWSAVGGDKESLVTLDQIWTPLRVADSQSRLGKVGTHENMTEEDKGVGLRELFESTNQSLLILGDPGSGKSTSLASFALGAARSWTKKEGSLLPIWVNLGAVVTGSGSKIDSELLLLAGVPEIEIAAARSGSQSANELSRFVRKMIVEGIALLLLDGLDEVKEHMLGDVRRAISNVVGLRNGTRIVATCRKFDYSQSAPNRKIPIERELELLPYNGEEQSLYIERWYAAAVRVGRFSPAQANELSAALIVELRTKELSKLGESPLLLALLTLIHSEEAKLPDTRAVLCDRAITYMLADSAKWRVREAGSSTIATPPVLSLAIELAYRSHLAEEAAGGTSSGVTSELVSELASQICEVMAQADTFKGAPSPQDLSRRFLKSHGLLLDIGSGRYQFAHRYFQEFLAGQYYAAGAHHDEAISRGASTHWREPFRLMASLAGHEGGNLFYILTLIDSLLSVEGESSVASIQLGAEMLTEIGRRRLALRQFGSVLSEDIASHGHQGLWARARFLVATHVENQNLTLSERERSAVSLGLLGDPRIVDKNGSLRLWTNLIHVPAGMATIGSSRLNPDVLSKSGGFPGDERCMEFGSLKIGRYLVTNAEFCAFVEGDGYENSSYWKGEFARGWMSGDPAILRTIREHWLSTVYEHHAKEIRDGEIDLKALEEEASSRTAPRQAPYYSFDRRFNQPNQPVVGVNWWEAAAFCEWATQRGHQLGTLALDHVILLPTEFEWEYVSRPVVDDRIFPWGDEWAEEKAHVSTNALNMRQPAPVGIYLESWPGAPCDLAGNVWEWTASLFLPYAAEFDPERLSADSLEERVVRGSSWYNSSIVAACSARAVDRSYNLFYDVGFRVVALHRDSERACSQ